MTELPNDFRLDSFEVYPDQSLLRSAAGDRHVEPKVMAVLQCLARQPESVVSRHHLLEQVWTGTVVSDEVVTRCISELRTLLGDNSKSPKYIQTVPKKGYRLLVKPALIGAAKSTTTPPAAPSSRPITAPRWRLAVAGFVLLAVGLYLGPTFIDAINDTLGRSPDVSQAPVPTDSALAILPFTSIEGGPDADYFGAGLAEELVNALVNVPGLRVASRSAAAGTSPLMDPVETAQLLGVDAILTGSVRRMDERVRVSAQLINATDGFHLWADQFEGDVGDVFRIQDHIAAAIVSALRLQLSEPVRVARISQDIDALDYYLLGRHHWHQRTPESLQRAVELFEQAVAVDPTMAIAYSGLGDAYLLLADYGDMPHADALRLATPRIMNALELDPKLAEAHASLGMLHLAQAKPGEAVAALNEAVRLNPGYHMALMWLGSAVAMQGNVADAHQYYERAYQLDPLHPVISQNLAMSFATLGDYQRSQEVIDGFDQRLQGHNQITILNLILATETGNFQRAIQLSEELEQSPIERNRIVGLQALALIHARRGEPALSQRYLERARRVGELQYDFLMTLARHYATAGERTKLEALLAAMNEKWGDKLRTEEYAVRGLLQIAQEDYAGAARWLEQALTDKKTLKRRPGQDLLVISNLVEVYRQLDNSDRLNYWHSQGDKIIEQARVAGFGHFHYVTQTGYFYAATGNPEAATEAFRHALTLGKIAPWELSEDARLKPLLDEENLRAVVAEAARTWPV